MAFGKKLNQNHSDQKLPLVETEWNRDIQKKNRTQFGHTIPNSLRISQRRALRTNGRQKFDGEHDNDNDDEKNHIE